MLWSLSGLKRRYIASISGRQFVCGAASFPTWDGSPARAERGTAGSAAETAPAPGTGVAEGAAGGAAKGATGETVKETDGGEPRETVEGVISRGRGPASDPIGMAAVASTEEIACVEGTSNAGPCGGGTQAPGVPPGGTHGAGADGYGYGPTELRAFVQEDKQFL